MSTPHLFIAALAVIILFGYLAGLMFRATRIPDILVLMGLGIALGPYGLGLVTPAQLEPLLPPFTTLALVMILFSGGLGMPLGTVLRGATVASLFTILVLAGCVALTTYATHRLLGWTISEGLMLGAITGGTSSATVLGLLRGAPVSERCKTLLSLESSITDVLCITLLMGLIQLAIDPGASIESRAHALGTQFGIGIIAGGVGGFIWGEIARRAKQLKLELMVTLAVVFLIYVGVEEVGGSGAVAVLVFGVVMASSRGRAAVARAASTETKLQAYSAAASETRELQTFHDELTFLLRTLFFIVLGVRFPLVNPGQKIWTVIAVLVVGWVVVRWLVAWPTGFLGRLSPRDRFVCVHLLPRGMVAAVLAALPGSIPLPSGGTLVSAARSAEFVLITFMLIGVTTVWASLAVFRASGVRDSASPSAAGSEQYPDARQAGG